MPGKTLFKRFNPVVLLLAFVLMQLCAGPLFSNDSLYQERENLIWANLGLGLGSRIHFDQSTSMTGVVNVTLQRGNRIISLRSSLSTTIVEASSSDLGILYGWSFKSPGQHISLAAGIAGTKYVVDSHSTTMIGIPLELQYFFTKGSRIGFYCFANINHKKSFYGVCLCLRLGKIK